MSQAILHICICVSTHRMSVSRYCWLFCYYFFILWNEQDCILNIHDLKPFSLRCRQRPPPFHNPDTSFSSSTCQCFHTHSLTKATPDLTLLWTIINVLMISSPWLTLPNLPVHTQGEYDKSVSLIFHSLCLHVWTM